MSRKVPGDSEGRSAKKFILSQYLSWIYNLADIYIPSLAAFFLKVVPDDFWDFLIPVLYISLNL